MWCVYFGVHTMRKQYEEKTHACTYHPLQTGGQEYFHCQEQTIKTTLWKSVHLCLTALNFCLKSQKNKWSQDFAWHHSLWRDGLEHFETLKQQLRSLCLLLSSNSPCTNPLCEHFQMLVIKGNRYDKHFLNYPPAGFQLMVCNMQFAHCFGPNSENCLSLF